MSDRRAAQAQRLRGPGGRLLLPPDPARAVGSSGRPLAAGAASARLEVAAWPRDALERVVLGDTTGTLVDLVLPEPEGPDAVRDVAELVRLACAATDEGRPSGRTQLVLRWPAGEDPALFTGAGLRLEAEICERAAVPPPGRRTPHVTVRPARATDAAALGELAREEARYHLPLTPFTRDLPTAAAWTAAAAVDDDPLRPVFVAERAGRVVGFAVCDVVDVPDDGLVRTRPPGRCGHLRSVAVTERERGHGVGSALVHGATGALVEAGAELLSLGFVAGNPTAEPFWLGLGFRPVWRIWMAVVADR